MRHTTDTGLFNGAGAHMWKHLHMQTVYSHAAVPTRTHFTCHAKGDRQSNSMVVIGTPTMQTRS